MALGSLVWRHGRSCGALFVRLAIDAHVGLFGGAQAVVHAVSPRRVERDAIGRIRREECWLPSVEESGDVIRVRRVAAEETVVAQEIELALLDVGLRGELRNVVGIDEAGRE